MKFSFFFWLLGLLLIAVILVAIVFNPKNEKIQEWLIKKKDVFQPIATICLALMALVVAAAQLDIKQHEVRKTQEAEIARLRASYRDFNLHRQELILCCFRLSKEFKNMDDSEKLSRVRNMKNVIDSLRANEWIAISSSTGNAYSNLHLQMQNLSESILKMEDINENPSFVLFRYADEELGRHVVNECVEQGLFHPNLRQLRTGEEQAAYMKKLENIARKGVSQKPENE